MIQYVAIGSVGVLHLGGLFSEVVLKPIYYIIAIIATKWGPQIILCGPQMISLMSILISVTFSQIIQHPVYVYTGCLDIYEVTILGIGVPWPGG